MEDGRVIAERNTWNDPISPERNAELIREHVERIKKSGGIKARREQDRQFSKIHDRMRKEHAALMDKYPRKWVVMGKDGVVALGDSLEEVVDEAHNRGFRASDMAVEFLDPDPPIYIL